MFQRWILSINQLWQINLESTWISRLPTSRRYFNIYQRWIKLECLLGKREDVFEVLSLNNHCTIMKFSIKDFFSKFEQTCWKLRIWSHLLKRSLMENFIFCAVCFNQWTIYLKTAKVSCWMKTMFYNIVSTWIKPEITYLLNNIILNASTFPIFTAFVIKLALFSKKIWRFARMINLFIVSLFIAMMQILLPFYWLELEYPWWVSQRKWVISIIDKHSMMFS